MVGFDAHKRIKGTKIHVVVTERPLPIAVTIGPADEHEGRKLIPLKEENSYPSQNQPSRRR